MLLLGWIYRQSMSTSLPLGRYLSASGVIRADAGGQTRAMLMRSRLLTAATARPVDVLSFDPSLHYDEIRAQLHEQGLLANGMQLLNLYEHHSLFGWSDDDDVADETLDPLIHLVASRTLRSDGSLWRTSYRPVASDTVVWHDYHRSDGSTYLRTHPYNTRTAAALPGELIRVGRSGQVLGRFSTLGQWYRHWIAELADGEPTFLFVDSRFLLPVIAPVLDPNIRLVYTLHNTHVAPGSPGDAEPLPEYVRCLDHLGDTDAFVTLTRRQSDAIAVTHGARPNQHVVANPVITPELPTPVPARDPHRVMMLARLVSSKRIEHAIHIMRQVVAEIPDAHLDVFGSGPRHDHLQRQIVRERLVDNITLHGHHTDATVHLWTASAYLLTSDHEGYPLATLESMSHGCPVVSYDVAYGPREQITDGVDGFLVRDGDITGAAHRVVGLLTDPALVRTMGDAGRATALRHDDAAFVEDWTRVLTAVTQTPARPVTLASVDMTLDPTSSAVDTERIGHWSGRLRLRPIPVDADPTQAVVALVAVDRRTGSVTPLPVRVLRDGLDFHFHAATGSTEVADTLSGSESVSIEVRLNWQNAYWSHELETLGAPPHARRGARPIDTQAITRTSVLRTLARWMHG